MSFLKSKHSGWTWDLKRTPFGGGGGGDVFSNIGQGIQDLGQTVVDNIIPIATTAAAVALAPETGGASLALDAELIASADAVALSTYGVPAAEAMASYGVAAADLGLPAAATAADVGAIAGTASSEFAGTAAGQQAIGMTAQAAAPATAQSSQALASQLGYSDPIAAIAGGVNPADLGMTQAAGGGGLSNLLGYAKTGAQIVGGLGQLTGGIGSLAAGNKVGQLAQKADPYSAYRPQNAAQLQNLLQNPQTITSTPGYQFNLGQGLQAMQAQQAAQGRLVSGGGLLQAQQFGQQFATSQLGQQQQLLAQLSGATQSPAGGAGAMAGLYGGQLGGQLGGLQSIAGGLGGIANPLGTLYANYNNPSPSVA
jgi:hypothetical protein